MLPFLKFKFKKKKNLLELKFDLFSLAINPVLIIRRKNEKVKGYFYNFIFKWRDDFVIFF